MIKLKLVSFLLSVVSFWLLAPAAMSHPHDETIPDARAKAIYIIKFLRFATWPQDVLAPQAPVLIGVAGATEIAQELIAQAGERPADKRKVSIVQLQPGDSLAGIHMLFIGNDQGQQQLNAWLEEAKGKPVLCVTDTGEKIPPGSMINFVHDRDRIRFDVSLTAAEHSRIELSAALLTVAREVYGGNK